MQPTDSPPSDRQLLGRAVVPVQLGDQVIVSILYNHDANPVHHRPDHALQWMLSLLAAQGVGASEGLENAGSVEKTYTLGTRLLAGEDIVVMPGIVLAAICYERFIAPTELTVSITTTFTYPLLVPTKGGVEVEVEAYEMPSGSSEAAQIAGHRKILIEAFGPGISGARVRLLKLEAVVFREGTSADLVYEKVVAPQFADLVKMKGKLAEMPALAHQSSISAEDRRRYTRIVEPGQNTATRPITESAWQCKIPRVLTEVIDHLRHNEAYNTEVNAYYKGRPDEAERREAIERYVEKECKYAWLKPEQKESRIDVLMHLQQHLYARQHTVFDPRQFRASGAATAPSAQITLDLTLSEMKLRRAIHKFYTGGRLKDVHVFMGEATVTAQPLVTREMASFLCEINHAFDTLKLLEYRHR